MSKNTFWYLIILQILLDCLKPTAWVLWGYGLCGYYNFSGLFQYVIFYPLIGYGLDQYFSETKFLTPKNIGRNLAVFVAAVLTQMMVYKDYLSVGNYQEVYLGTWLSVPVIVIFLNTKLLFQEERLSERTKKILVSVGGCVFGCYLLGGFIGTGGRLDVIAGTLTPVTGMLPAYIIEIIIAFLIEVQGSSQGQSSSSFGSNTTAKPQTVSNGQAVVNYAAQFVGNPYVYGGSSLTNGADCSGFVMSVYQAFGISLPHSSSALRSVGYGVSLDAIQPGDIVCYSGHVGIYAGNNTLLHASSPSTGIKYTSPVTYREILAIRRIF